MNLTRLSTLERHRYSFFGILSGLIAYIVLGSISLFLLRSCWADYAMASKDKSYTTGMLFSRLFVAIISSVFAGMVATKISGDKGRIACFAGLIIFCIASYIHFFKVWDDYPLWYHLSYLVPIIPVTTLSHYFISKKLFG